MRVAVRERAEIPFRLDQLEDRGVVVHHVRHVVLARVRRDDHRRHPEPVAVVGAGQVRRHVDLGRDVVGLDRRGRRHMVVVTAVLVEGPDQQRLRPRGALHHRVDDGCREPLTLADVLGILFGLDAEVRVDERHRRQLPRGCVSEELRGLRDPVLVLDRDRRNHADCGGEIVVVVCTTRCCAHSAARRSSRSEAPAPATIRSTC